MKTITHKELYRKEIMKKPVQNTEPTQDSWRERLRKRYDELFLNTLNPASINYWDGIEPELEDFISKELIRERKKSYQEGFLKGFNDCKQIVEKGKHSHCCIIPNKLLSELEEDTRE